MTNWVAIVGLTLGPLFVGTAQGGINKCADLLSDHESVRLSETELSSHVSNKIIQVPEFDYIRSQAERMGIRVWLFGGTASSFLHYVKWDLSRSKGILDLQADRFDFDFTNIFRSTQDLDIVVDAAPEVAGQFRSLLAKKFPHFLGSKANKWEVRTLRHRMGQVGQTDFKEALLNDSDFNNQNTDSNSVGMVEVTRSNDPVIRDLRHWDETKSVFLEDTLSSRISFFRNDKHFTTSRTKAGGNPEILSVIRLLVKAFQYELEFSREDFEQMKAIVQAFDPRQVNNQAALRRIQDTAKKLVMHAVNIEYAMNQLDQLGLRQKLIAMGAPSIPGDQAWWLSREPLRSKPVGQGTGRTAKELDIQVVAHETNSFLAYESITRAHSGEPNVLISRQNAVGEVAAFGDGFYTSLGKLGARGTGLTIRFTVDPNAREGSDFTVNGDFIVFRNKRALRVIQESLNFGVDDLLRLAENNQEMRVDPSDLGLLEKLKRRLTASRITDELEILLNSASEDDHDRLRQILSAFHNSGVSKLISEDVLPTVAKNIYGSVEGQANSSNERDILRYIKTVSLFIKTLDKVGLLRTANFIHYLEALSKSPRISYELRKEAVFEILLNSESFESCLGLRRDLPKPDLRRLTTEMKDWHRSVDSRKRKFSMELNKSWLDAIDKGEIKKIEVLIGSSLSDVNHKNISGYSMLLLADYFGQKEVIDWITRNPDYDFNARNALGYTEVEQLRLLGKNELADQIEKSRPEATSRRIVVRERNADEKTEEYPEGTPIIDFVKIEPGSFLTGEGERRVVATISQSFEWMSVKTTQKMYEKVVRLSQEYLSDGFDSLDPTPSEFRGENKPVHGVSFNDVALWNKGINALSKLSDARVQEELVRLFPGHQRGDQYGLPTAVQGEYVSRLGGLSSGLYAHGNSNAHLADYAQYLNNSKARIGPGPVGKKKPVFYNGKPIYDLHGLMWEWCSDGGNIPGGTTPDGPFPLHYRELRGGFWGSDWWELRSSSRSAGWPWERGGNDGFRLVRSRAP